MNHSALSEETKQSIKAISHSGFEFVKLLQQMPKEVELLYGPYFRPGLKPRHAIQSLLFNFSSVGLAIVAGHSPEARLEHLKKKRKERADAKKKSG